MRITPDRRGDLKRGRARVRHQVILLETVEQRMQQLARSQPDLSAVPKLASRALGGSRADATLREPIVGLSMCNFQATLADIKADRSST
jgi:hypothetical protein